MNEERELEKLNDTNVMKAFGHDSKISKIIRYKWRKPGKMGRFMMIEKGKVNIDLKYQREPASQKKITDIARNFDWALFGVIIVVIASDGYIFVIDGGHRVRASLLRDDITKIPCCVFKQEDISSEAALFYGLNKYRSQVSPFDTHKAGLQSANDGQQGFEIHKISEEIVTKYGYQFAKNASGQFTTAAINTINALAGKNADLTDRTFGLLAKIAQGLPIRNEELKGLYYVIAYNPHEDFEGYPLKNLIRVGLKGIQDEIKRATMSKGKGNHIVFARAIVNIINKGRPNSNIIVPE